MCYSFWTSKAGLTLAETEHKIPHLSFEGKSICMPVTNSKASGLKDIYSYLLRRQMRGKTYLHFVGKAIWRRTALDLKPNWGQTAKRRKEIIVHAVSTPVKGNRESLLEEMCKIKFLELRWVAWCIADMWVRPSKPNFNSHYLCVCVITIAKYVFTCLLN